MAIIAIEAGPSQAGLVNAMMCFCGQSSSVSESMVQAEGSIHNGVLL